MLAAAVIAVWGIAPPIGEAAVPSIPTPYHNGSTLVCSDCHTMHYSQQHEYGGAAGQGIPSLAGGPTGKLLRRSSSVAICLACHDGRSGIPDVLQGDTNSLGDNRAAGYFPEVADTTTYKGHNLGAAPGDLCTRCHFGGDFTTAKVTCVDCHNPHGNAKYRNLQWASDPSSTPPIIALTKSGVSGIDKYDQNNTGYTAPAGADGWREVTNICIDCHHVFTGAGYTGATSPYTKHPGTDSERGVYYPINRVGANTDPAHWEAGTGNGFSIDRVKFMVRGADTFVAATTVAQNNEVFCLSCHKAHGSGNAFGLRWAYGTGAPGVSQAACEQCHNK